MTNAVKHAYKENNNVGIINIYFEILEDKIKNEICDRVAVMKNGEIVELNNTEDIIKHPQSDYAKQLISEVAVIAK